MPSTNWLSTSIAVVGVAASLWLYRANRSLHDQVDQLEDATKVAAAAPAAAADDVWSGNAPRSGNISRAARSAAPPPVLSAPPPELKLDRRARKLQEFTALFGRLDGESEADYRARIGPLLSTGLAIPRMKEADMRKQAETAANVTPEQSRALDHAFEKTYGQVLDYANKAVADGALSPYAHDFSGWLEFAGGLGGILTDTQGQLGQILSPDQIKQMNASGFDWGEYLGAQAPWEKLSAPPPPK